MLRLLRFLVVGTGLLVLAIVLVGFFMPGSWSAERSRTLRAPPEKVHAVLEDLRSWSAWSHWTTQRDGSAVFTFDGPDKGAGSRMSFEGQILAFGSVTLVKADPPRGVEYEIRFRGVDEVTRGSILLEPDGTGTRATWREGGELGRNPIMRMFSPLMSAKLGQDFAGGLERLEARVESAR